MFCRFCLYWVKDEFPWLDKSSWSGVETPKTWVGKNPKNFKRPLFLVREWVFIGLAPLCLISYYKNNTICYKVSRGHYNFWRCWIRLWLAEELAPLGIWGSEVTIESNVPAFLLIWNNTTSCDAIERRSLSSSKAMMPLVSAKTSQFLAIVALRRVLIDQTCRCCPSQ